MKYCSKRLIFSLVPVLSLVSNHCGGGSSITSTSSAVAAATGTLAVAPVALQFGSQSVGSPSASQLVTISNSGKRSFSLTGLTISSAVFGITNAPTLPLSISGGQSVAIQVTFTPAVSGPTTAVLNVATSGAAANGATVSLSGSGSAPTPGTSHLITTTGLHAALLGAPYEAVLSASGGTAPYRWTLAAGSSLPAGLVLDPGGTITGTPTVAGIHSVSVVVTDSGATPLTGGATFNLLVGSATLDEYGGATEMPCPAGPAPHFYTAKISGRWWLCTPAGNVFWMRGVYHADASDPGADQFGVELDGTACVSLLAPALLSPCSAVAEKYGDASVTWGPQIVRRMKSWGFNTAAEYASLYVLPTTTSASWNTPDHANPAPIAFTGLLWPAHYSRNPNAYANPVKDLIAPVAGSVYTGYRHAMPDIFDPNFALWLQKDLADPANVEYNWIHSPHSDYLVGFNVDDTDELMGFGAGPDFPTLTDGVPDGGNGRTEPNLGWIVLVTPPTQLTGVDANGNPIAYTDTTVYSKQELANWLSARYGGSIAALNSAWGSNYTTFGDSGGWGTGSGLLDEDGTHAWVPRDPYRLDGATAAMAQDLNDFLQHFADHYFSVIKQTLATEAPGILYLGPTTLGGWGAPPRQQILAAAAPYLDVLPVASIPTGCASCNDQARVDFITQYGGDKPWIAWEGYLAQPDSPLASDPGPDTTEPQSATQAARGQLFASRVQLLMMAHDSASGTYHVVGYKWWELYDNRGEQADWGLLTRRDNAYDGSAITALGMDSWGFPSGGEPANYGDFLTAVTSANFAVYRTLLNLP